MIINQCSYRVRNEDCFFVKFLMRNDFFSKICDKMYYTELIKIGQETTYFLWITINLQQLLL